MRRGVQFFKFTKIRIKKAAGRAALKTAAGGGMAKAYFIRKAFILYGFIKANGYIARPARDGMGVLV